MTFRVSTPVPDYTGVVGNCAFANGVYKGLVEPGPLGYFLQAGYTVEDLDEPEDTEPPVEPDPLPARSASKADWVAAAIARGMSEEDTEKLTRDELVALYTKEGGQ